MTKKITLFASLFALLISALSTNLSAQQPKDMWEVGAQAGYMFVSGDVAHKPGYGYGVHIRKATDHIFSLRFDALMGSTKGDSEDDSNRTFEMDWLSATGFGVFSLNNFRFDRTSAKKTNLYAMIGGGLNSFETTFTAEGADIANPRVGAVAKEWAPQVVAGGGFAIRCSKRLNVAIEHQVFFTFGDRRDKLDGIFIETNAKISAFSDLLQFTSLQVNYNIGNPSNKSEPLYWVNALGDMRAELDNVKKRTDEAFADTDGDGVFDVIDAEPNTPADVPVDTKGRTLDSDKDGVADYQDKEPYYPPRAGEKVNEDGVVVNPIAPPGGGGGVTEGRVQEMIDEALSKYDLNEPKGNVADWFLPMIHFGTNSATVKYSDYGTLASIARMMKSNPNIRIVVTGYTDEAGSEDNNSALSYDRAKGIIEHLTNQHGIGRGRLVLQWEGEGSPLVPQSVSYMNRRVEFRSATSEDTEMDPPSGYQSSGSGGY